MSDAFLHDEISWSAYAFFFHDRITDVHHAILLFVRRLYIERLSVKREKKIRDGFSPGRVSHWERGNQKKKRKKKRTILELNIIWLT